MLTYACARKRGNARLVGGAGPIAVTVQSVRTYRRATKQNSDEVQQ